MLTEQHLESIMTQLYSLYKVNVEKEKKRKYKTCCVQSSSKQAT